jgi:hypothetical protein
MKVNLNISRYLQEGSGPQIEIDLDELLEQNRLIAHVWAIEDVQKVRPDLSDDQAWEVLCVANGRFDSENGITWEILEFFAEQVFGPEESSSK